MVKKLLQQELLSPFGVLRDDGTIERGTDNVKQKYLLLVFATDEKGNEVKTFDVYEGRYDAANAILSDYPAEYWDSLDIFRSLIISDKVTVNRGISFYSFIRMCIENNKFTPLEIEQLGLGDMTADDYSETALETYQYQASKLEILTIDDLNKFYMDDISGDGQ